MTKALAPATAATAKPAVWVPSMGMAAESMADMRKRISATHNVAKLTGVMKLVAASKLKGCEARLKAARPFGLSLLNSVAEREDADAEAEEGAVKDATKHLFVVVSTDRGLCGSVNSQITRAVAPTVKELEKAGDSVEIFVLGDKGGQQLGRLTPKHLVRKIDQCLDKDPAFGLAAAIAEKVVSREFDLITFWYNEFENAAKFNLTTKRVPLLAGMPVGVRPTMFADYSVEPEDNEEALLNMMEYGVAGSLYYMLLENQASEMASRMIAMEGATNNAIEMADALTLLYNRARQAKITTELTEIISGAESIAAAEDDD